MRRVMITGCEGFIGRRLFFSFVKKGYAVLGIDPRCSSKRIGDSLTLTQLGAKDMTAWHPDVIVLCGAVKSLVDCRARVTSVHANVFDLEKYLQCAWCRRNIHVVFVSSDMVFGGLPGQGLFTENHPVLAANAYGRMKIAGEQLVSLLPCTSIIRTSLVYGELSDEEQSFYSDMIGKRELTNQSLFFYWALEQVRRLGKVNVAANVFSSPTWVEDLVRDIIQVVEKRLLGIFHSCGPERLSRFEMLQRVLSPLGMEDTLVSQIVRRGGIRPLDVSLDAKMTRQKLGTICHKVDEVMTSVVRRRIAI